jgi:hypothetical protein
MEAVVLDEIPFQLDPAALREMFRIKQGSRYIQELEGIAAEAQAIAGPKAMYRVAGIDSLGQDHAVVEGVTLTSRALRVSLEETHRLFPYVATCGTELADYADSLDGQLQRYWVEEMAGLALRVALEALEKHLEERFGLGKTAHASPGSLVDWPIREQRPLFALLGNPGKAVGVELTDTLLMTPLKSVSGVIFATEDDLESCRLCPREGCPSRRVPYEAGLYESKYL